MASAVVTGIGIAFVSTMLVLASVAPRAAVARGRFRTILMIDSYVGPSAGPDFGPYFPNLVSSGRGKLTFLSNLESTCSFRRRTQLGSILRSVTTARFPHVRNS